jgi:hypothetical protein
VIAILGDPEKRKVYDETGSIEHAVSCVEVIEETNRSACGLFTPVYMNNCRKLADYSVVYIHLCRRIVI